MKRYADVLVDREKNIYERVNIWTILDWRKNKIDLWEKYKDCFYSTNKDLKDKVPMTFKLGRGGIECKSYFAYKNASSAHEGEGYEETYRHEFFKECFSRLKQINLRWKNEAVNIYVDEVLQEETIYGEDGNKRIVDTLIKFTKADPMIYVEKWNGKLALEVFETHQVGPAKIDFMKKNEIAMFEFVSKKWNSIKDNANSKEEEEKQIEKIVGVLSGYVSGILLSDPISKEYFCTVRLEEELAKNKHLEKNIKDLENDVQRLLMKKELLEEKIDNLNIKIHQSQREYESIIQKNNCENNTLRIENEDIKSHWWYKVFWHKR